MAGGVEVARVLRRERAPLENFLSEAKESALDAIGSLSAGVQQLLGEWRHRIQIFGVGAEDFPLPADPDMDVLVHNLRKAPFASLQRELQNMGKEWARRGLRPEQAVAAAGVLLELVLASLLPRRAEESLQARAIARLHCIVVFLLLSGYSKNWISARRELEHELSAAEQRLQAESAYLTSIYERERRSLCQDLHDDIGHDLVMLKMYLELIASSTKNGGDPRALAPRVEESLGLVSRAIESVRRIVLNLGPVILDDLGLASAIKLYARQFAAGTQMEVQVEVGRLPELLPSSHQVAMYRVLQGALSNVAKHARAKHVRLSLGSLKEKMLVMVIEDDGIGFDASALSPRRSFGLTAMRDRIESLGGRIHIESRGPGPVTRKRGTKIYVDLPLPAAARRERDK